MGAKERILQYADIKGIKVSDLEKKLSLGRNYFRNTAKVSVDVVVNFLSVFSEVSPEWLLKGEGDTLVKRGNIIEISSNQIKEGVCTGAPVYDIDGTCGTKNRDICFAEDNIIGYVDLPEISNSSKIIRANGDSMEPKIYDGNRVVIREIMSWSDIFYGQIYLVITEEYRMIKYIRRYEQDEENYIILRSENKEYDDIKLHKNKIRKLFIVENILSIKNQI